MSLLSEEQLKRFQAEIQKLEAEKLTVDARLAAMQGQIERRDKEIQRLAGLLEVSRSWSLLAKR